MLSVPRPRPIACLVLPTYNERSNLQIVLPRIFDQAARIPTHELHILVVDDNSPDATADVVREAMPIHPELHLLTGEKRGLGDAYLRGMAHAMHQLRPALLLEMDADGQHDPALLPHFIRSCAERSSAEAPPRLVIGSRFLPGAALQDFGPIRRALSHTGGFLVRFFGGVGPVSDCTSGFRCFPSELLRNCDFGRLPTRGYSFQIALLFELVRNGAQVVELPLIFAPRLHGQSKLTLRDCVEFVITLAGLTIRRFSSKTKREKRSANKEQPAANS